MDRQSGNPNSESDRKGRAQDINKEGSCTEDQSEINAGGYVDGSSVLDIDADQKCTCESRIGMEESSVVYANEGSDDDTIIVDSPAEESDALSVDSETLIHQMSDEDTPCVDSSEDNFGNDDSELSELSSPQDTFTVNTSNADIRYRRTSARNILVSDGYAEEEESDFGEPPFSGHGVDMEKYIKASYFTGEFDMHRALGLILPPMLKFQRVGLVKVHSKYAMRTLPLTAPLRDDGIDSKLCTIRRRVYEKVKVDDFGCSSMWNNQNFRPGKGNFGADMTVSLKPLEDLKIQIEQALKLDEDTTKLDERFERMCFLDIPNVISSDLSAGFLAKIHGTKPLHRQGYRDNRKLFESYLAESTPRVIIHSGTKHFRETTMTPQEHFETSILDMIVNGQADLATKIMCRYFVWAQAFFQHNDEDVVQREMERRGIKSDAAEAECTKKFKRKSLLKPPSTNKAKRKKITKYRKTDNFNSSEDDGATSNVRGTGIDDVIEGLERCFGVRDHLESMMRKLDQNLSKGISFMFRVELDRINNDLQKVKKILSKAIEKKEHVLKQHVATQADKKENISRQHKQKKNATEKKVSDRRMHQTT